MDPLEGEQFRTALDALLASDSFARSPALTRLLTYLVEQVLAGETSSLKESVIGHVLYGRPASYDPKLDSLVRVSANRLRTRMEAYYRAHPEVRVCIVLPRGAYVPLLEILEPSMQPEPARAHPNKNGQLPDEGLSSHTSSSNVIEREATPLLVEEGQSSRPYWGVFFATVLAVTFVVVFLWTRSRHAAAAVADTAWSVRPFARMGGSQQFGAFSPDGTSLAFTSTDSHHGNKTIYIQAIASEEPRRIATGVRPAWSPDGKRLAFLRPGARGKKQIILYDLATNTDSLLTELDGSDPWLCGLPRLSWSRDGNLLYSSASTGGRTSCGIVSIDLATGQIRPLTLPVSQIGDLEPAVSPDGKTIAFLRGLGIAAPDLFIVSTNGSGLRRVTHDAADITGFDWDANGRALIVASSREGGARKLWRMPISKGQAQLLTDGSTPPTFPSVSPNGKQINFTQFHIKAPIWKMDGDKPVEILDNQSENRAPSVSPDGKKMLYSSDRSGTWEIWLSNVDGSDPRPLLRGFGRDTGWPRWSPDGSKVVMECRVASHTQMCVSNADGSGVHLLAGGNSSQVQPSWSHDGRYVYFADDSSGEKEIYRTDIASGAIEAMTHLGGLRAIESWDGEWLYVSRGLPHGGMVALPLQGTVQERKAAENTLLLPELSIDAGSAWDVCKDGVVYLVASPGALPRLAVFDRKTNQSRTIITLSDIFPETDVTFGVLPDGHGIVFTTGNTHSELNLMMAR